jgi:hypothetical protein
MRCCLRWLSGSGSTSEHRNLRAENQAREVRLAAAKRVSILTPEAQRMTICIEQKTHSHSALFPMHTQIDFVDVLGNSGLPRLGSLTWEGIRRNSDTSWKT